VLRPSPDCPLTVSRLFSDCLQNVSQCLRTFSRPSPVRLFPDFLICLPNVSRLSSDFFQNVSRLSCDRLPLSRYCFPTLPRLPPDCLPLCPHELPTISCPSVSRFCLVCLPNVSRLPPDSLLIISPFNVPWFSPECHPAGSQPSPGCPPHVS